LLLVLAFGILALGGRALLGLVSSRSCTRLDFHVLTSVYSATRSVIGRVGGSSSARSYWPCSLGAAQFARTRYDSFGFLIAVEDNSLIRRINVRSEQKTDYPRRHALALGGRRACLLRIGFRNRLAPLLQLLRRFVAVFRTRIAGDNAGEVVTRSLGVLLVFHRASVKIESLVKPREVGVVV